MGWEGADKRYRRGIYTAFRRSCLCVARECRDPGTLLRHKALEALHELVLFLVAHRQLRDPYGRLVQGVDHRAPQDPLSFTRSCVGADQLPRGTVVHLLQQFGIAYSARRQGGGPHVRIFPVKRFEVNQHRLDDGAVWMLKPGTSGLHFGKPLGLVQTCAIRVRDCFVLEGTLLRTWSPTAGGFALVQGALPFVRGAPARRLLAPPQARVGGWLGPLGAQARCCAPARQRTRRSSTTHGWTTRRTRCGGPPSRPTARGRRSRSPCASRW